MPGKDNSKTLCLIELLKTDPTISTREACEKSKLTKSYVNVVRRWINKGCIGPIVDPHKPELAAIPKQKKKLVKVKCLGNHSLPYYFLSKSKFLRLCPTCTEYYNDIAVGGFAEYETL